MYTGYWFREERMQKQLLYLVNQSKYIKLGLAHIYFFLNRNCIFSWFFLDLTIRKHNQQCPCSIVVLSCICVGFLTPSQDLKGNLSG